MTARKTGGHAWVIGSLLAIAVPFCNSADAAGIRKISGHEVPSHHRALAVRDDAYRFAAGRSHLAKGGMKSKGRVLARRGFQGLQCVAFARQETGMQIAGNAADWWINAAGTYLRGHRPELGSVLNFRANGRMHLGHVAVVTNVIDSRQIDIDQANWPTPGLYRGGVAHDIRVVDVSPANDWTAVRVALGHSSEFGSVYPTYGFIYDRADTGAPDTGAVVTAEAAGPAPLPPLNPAPADLRTGSHPSPTTGESVAYDEVAEAPAASRLARHRKLHALVAHVRARHRARTS
jgi:surface antigen